MLPQRTDVQHSLPAVVGGEETALYMESYTMRLATSLVPRPLFWLD